MLLISSVLFARRRALSRRAAGSGVGLAWSVAGPPSRRKFRLVIDPAAEAAATAVQTATVVDTTALAALGCLPALALEPFLARYRAEAVRPRSSYRVVDTREGVQALGLALQRCPAVAVDVEHHRRHSFLGYVCLIQLSTPEEDVIVDCLQPEVRAALQAALRPVFQDPRTVKVLHACANDILWLHSNFGL